ncbi:polysaccharide deacetylase family protein [Gelidibacter pelagius]|uniref:Lipocalin-like domain-containing protein n=1 Tax=Gelidibacter pelagius TaxID=2819985 RepID=A0ABS3SX62_9FLAO|nr:hypothetical protein [Gelidibacter pelagius]MBO3100324.1 hypothetical protein [Gelidibacter pelagius]
MKKTRFKLLLLFITGLIISCSNDDEVKIAGLGDFSGNYRLNFVTNSSTYCYNNDVSSIDLEISSNGRFKQKIFILNNNEECVLTEILEGQITITKSFNMHPDGTVVYDNSEISHHIFLPSSVDGVHNKLRIAHSDGSAIQFIYFKTI